jgi:hypothetical protein
VPGLARTETTVQWGARPGVAGRGEGCGTELRVGPMGGWAEARVLLYVLDGGRAAGWGSTQPRSGSMAYSAAVRLDGVAVLGVGLGAGRLR